MSTNYNNSSLYQLDLTNLIPLFNELKRKTKGYDIYLGGGLLRDLFFNGHSLKEKKTPKDIDIFFIPNGDTKVLPTLAQSYIQYDKDASEVADMAERGVASVRGLFIKWVVPQEVQFIEYKNYISQEDLAADMDCNVNQIMVCITAGKRFATEAFYEGHANKKIKMLHTFDKTRMENRISRMASKFTEYSVESGWEVTLIPQTPPKKYNNNHGSFCDSAGK